MNSLEWLIFDSFQGSKPYRLACNNESIRSLEQENAPDITMHACLSSHCQQHMCVFDITVAALMTIGNCSPLLGAMLLKDSLTSVGRVVNCQPECSLSTLIHDEISGCWCCAVYLLGIALIGTVRGNKLALQSVQIFMTRI